MSVVYFLLVLSILMLGAHALLAWRLGHGLVAQTRRRVWLLVLAHAPLAPASIALTRLAAAPDWVAQLGYIDLGFFSIVLAGVVFVLALDLARSLMARLGLPFDADRRGAFLKTAHLMVVGGAAAETAWGYAQTRAIAEVEEVDLPIAGLAPALVGLRIVQVSDLHVGMPGIDADHVRRVVERVNGLGPDLIAVTGDLVDGSVARLMSATAPLAELRARHGAWFITGNHEYYSGIDDWVERCRDLGMRVLLNEHKLLEHDGARLLVAGVTDRTAARMRPDHACDPAAACNNAPDADLRLMLAHQPKGAEEVAALGFDVQLSGHTHGGQYFPGTVLIGLIQPFVAGLHRVGQMWLYVSRGSAWWGPPLRVGSPAEITLLVLRAG
jgi:uncharacterized protein